MLLAVQLIINYLSLRRTISLHGHNVSASSGEPADYQQLKSSVSELSEKMTKVIAALKALNNAVVVGTASGGITATEYSKLKVVPVSNLD